MEKSAAEPIIGESPAVRTVVRALAVLEAVGAAGGGIGAAAVAEQVHISVGSAHRLLQTLVRTGYVRQTEARKYVLGPGLVGLAVRAHQALAAWAQPVLAEVTATLGETSNLAALDHDRAVYLAQAPSQHAMRTFTEVGHRVLPHCTGVGKALLSQLADDEVRALVRRTGLPAATSRTLVTLDALLSDLARIRRRGYALDDGEQDTGVRCIAVPVPGELSLAISISGPVARLPSSAIRTAHAVLAAAAERIAVAAAGGGRVD